MNTTPLSIASLRALRNDLRGDTVVPGAPEYDEVRGVYNAMHDRWPSLIVRAADTRDVAITLRFAAEEGVLLAVRGGNHSMPGYGSCDDGVVLDLSGMRSVDVDPKARLARVAGGATWGDVNTATHVHGLATTGGVVSTTGVGGLTLGGGIGYLTRRLGLACDNLLAAEVVTARGEILDVDEERHPDLLWALRGGGNLGVVTSFTLRLAPVESVVGGPLVFASEPDVLKRYMQLMRDAPRELGAVLGLTLAPPLPFIPAERHGEPCAVVITCWTGDEAQGHDVLGGLADLGTLWGQGIGTLPSIRSSMSSCPRACGTTGNPAS